ncbi:Clan SB, family S8, subtilisin-like serine peptidase [Trichomonas vaginalis G3]|uniref:Clan SB, family S8, subtilisin-like serine peptidase n=1 Tax=Trichomonas vaginalis (strain ATCC PRA-98 / G3) TaxID=412133 RepID=A2DAQ7_TRIV3|nr:proprotein convertase-related family [Trichomonas vaginalis G3]EAY22560.1 Clan SB, family S8, subtilisin-like serine peptidase [Trichomonas vaginalis G3]KAI5497292.1 proprotein convertase-related family [Trichomonas vaginalis G3]|eukprot:XP_001583546.1 Clan SB, family S8, subtilisin-like serine peptidase [Trichomonas vaginalis G3]
MSYLDQDEYNYFTSTSHFDIEPYLPKYYNNINYSSTNHYFVRASESWHYPTQCEPSGFETFSCKVVDNDMIDDILSDEHVLSVEPSSPIEFHARFAVGFSEVGTNSLGYDGWKLRPDRRLTTLLGLTGDGQTVTIVDDGVDFSHTFFSDSIVSIDGPNTYPTHRKIYKYENWTNSSTEFNISDHVHGTYCAGLIAGTPEADYSANALYEGAATNAKLHVIEISDTTIDSQINFTKLTESMDSVGSKISSNSWASSGYSPTLTNALNKAAFENPDKLFLFPATGNKVASPADAINVLTVGSSTRQQVSNIENNPNSNLVISIWSGEKPATLYSNETFFYQTKSPIIDYSNLSISNISGDGLMKYSYECVENIPDGTRVLVYLDNLTNCSRTGPILILTTSEETINQMTNESYGRITYKNDFDWGNLNYPFETGPTLDGIRKPDVIFAGSGTKSARANSTLGDTSFDSLISLDGTSGATALAAGELALVREFFEKGYYPSGQPNPDDAFSPSGNLLRAIAVNSGRQGYFLFENLRGPSILADPLGVGADTPFNGGIRILDNVKIGPNEHFVYEFNTTKTSGLSVTMAYLDLPLPRDDGHLVYIDLNLVVEAAGTTIAGNSIFNTHEADQRSTVERAYIRQIDPTTVKIHIFSNDFHVDDDVDVTFALSITAGIDTKNDAVPFKLQKLENPTCPANCSGQPCGENGVCQCEGNSRGYFCQTVMFNALEGQASDELLPTNAYLVNWHYVDVEGGYKLIPKINFQIWYTGLTKFYVIASRGSASVSDAIFMWKLDVPQIVNSYFELPELVIEEGGRIYFAVFSDAISPQLQGFFGYRYAYNFKVEARWIPTPMETPIPSPTPPPSPTFAETPVETVFETPYLTAFETAFSTAHSTPFETSFETPFSTAFSTASSTAFSTPYDTPFLTAFETAFDTPFSTAHSTPFSTAHQTPDLSKAVTPFETPFITAFETVFSTASSTPFETAFSTPHSTPFSTAFETMFDTPFITFNPTPVETISPTRSLARTIAQGGAAVSTSSNTEQQKDNGSSSKSNPLNFMIIGIVCTLILISLIIVGIVLYVRHKKNNEDNNSNDKSAESSETDPLNVDAEKTKYLTEILTTIAYASDTDDPFFNGDEDDIDPNNIFI